MSSLQSRLSIEFYIKSQGIGGLLDDISLTELSRIVKTETLYSIAANLYRQPLCLTL
jgi:hypothetical protein